MSSGLLRSFIGVLGHYSVEDSWLSSLSQYTSTILYPFLSQYSWTDSICSSMVIPLSAGSHGQLGGQLLNMFSIDWIGIGLLARAAQPRPRCCDSRRAARPKDGLSCPESLLGTHVGALSIVSEAHPHPDGLPPVAPCLIPVLLEWIKS